MGVNRGNAAFMYANEALPASKQPRWSAYLFGIDGLVSVAIALLFWSGVVTWRIFFFASFVLMGLAWLIVAQFFPESPAYLFETGKYYHLKQALASVAKLNCCY